MRRWPLVLLAALAVAACDALAPAAVGEGDAGAVDVDGGDEVSTQPDASPPAPMALLDASVWSADELERRVAACHAWHTRQAELAGLPAPDRVVDCRPGRPCVVDVTLEPPSRVSLDVVLTWDDGDPDTDDTLALPDGSGDAPVVVARDTLGDEHVLEAEGCGAGLCFAAFLPAGRTWHVELRQDRSDSTLPLGMLTLAEALVLDDDVVLHRDLGAGDASRLQLHVTLEGEPLVDEAQWQLQLEPLGDDGEPFEDFPTRWASHTVDHDGQWLFPGRWRVDARWRDCGDCPAGQLRAADALQMTAGAGVELDVDFVVVELGGDIAPGSEAFSPYEAGELWLTPDDGRPALFREIELTESSWSMTLYPGTFHVALRDPYTDRELVLAEALEVERDTRLDLALQALPPDTEPRPERVHVTGTVHLSDGASTIADVFGAYADVEAQFPRADGEVGVADRSELDVATGRFELDLLPGHHALLITWRWYGNEQLRRLSHDLWIEPGVETAPLELHLPPLVPLVGRISADISEIQQVELTTPWQSARHAIDRVYPRRNELELSRRVFADVYDLRVWVDYGARHATVLASPCQPVSGIERVDAVIEHRHLTLAAVDPAGLALTGTHYQIERIATPGGYPVDETSFDLDGDAGASRVEIGLLPGRHRVTASVRDTTTELIVEVR